MSGLIGAVSGWLGSATGKLKAGKKLLAADKPAEAFPLLAQAAQSGLPEAEFLVARAYLEGRGVPRAGWNARRRRGWRMRNPCSRRYIFAASRLWPVR